MKLVYCFHLKTNSALEVSCHTPVLQRSTFLTVLEYEVENRGKGPCYSSVLKKLEIPTMRLSSSTKPSQVALLALPSCCVVSQLLSREGAWEHSRTAPVGWIWFWDHSDLFQQQKDRTGPRFTEILGWHMWKLISPYSVSLSSKSF